MSMKKKEEKTEEPVQKKHNLAQKIALRVTIITVLALILGLVLFIFIKQLTTVHTETDVAMVNSQLSFCQELVVGQYNYTDVIALKKKAGLAKSYSIVKYGGIIRAGIKNIKDITYTVSENRQQIVLRIPPAEILGNEITTQEIFDEKQSIFVKITTQEIFEEIATAKVNVQDMLISQGLLDQSWHHAATIIEQFMYGLGFQEVVIKIK